MKNKKIPFKKRLYKVYQKNKSSKKTQNVSCDFNDISYIKDNEKEKDNDINSYNKDSSTFNLLKLDKDSSYSYEDVFWEMQRKLTLTKLKLNITKFEKSNRFSPNSNEMKNNALQPYMFISKKYKYSRKADYFNLKKNKYRSIILMKKNKRPLSSSKKISFTNEYQSLLNKDNNYLNLTKRKNKSLIENLNNITKTIKKGIKKDESKIKFIKDLMKYFKGDNATKQDINKEIIKEISNYQLKKGQYIMVGGRILDVGHLSDVGLSKFYM